MEAAALMGSASRDITMLTTVALLLAVSTASAGEPRCAAAQIKLSGTGGVNDVFGYSVAVDGSVVLVSAPRGVVDGVGVAYLFDVRAVRPLVLPKTLAASADGDWFGVAVALSGSTAVVGAHSDRDIVYANGAKSVAAARATGSTDDE